MPRNKSQFRNAMKLAFTNATKDSQQAAFATASVDENDSHAEVSTKMSNACANAFAESLFPTMTDIIDNYLNSLEFDVTGLSNGAGAVSGVLKVKP